MEPAATDLRRTADSSKSPARRHPVRITSTPTARATLCLAAAALLVTGCASRQTSSSSSSKLPKLLIATTADAAAPAAAAAIAPAAGGPENRTGIFGGYVIAGTLPDQPTHAPIYLWPSTKPTQSDVVKLAAALGLNGTPIRHAHGWDLKTAAGELRLRDDQGQQWSYVRADTAQCPPFQTDIDNPDGVSTGFGCAVAVSPAAGTRVDGPDEAATKAAAASLLTALGITGDQQFSAGAPTSYLNVSPKVAGLPTQGIDTNINVDARGITGATGQLQAPTAGDDYPLQTAKAAFDSLAARPQPMIAMYCGPVPNGPNRFGGVAPSAGTANGATTTIESGPPAVPSPTSTPSAVPPTKPIAPPVPVNSASVGSPPADATQPVEVSPVPCPTPEPTKITGAHLGLEVEYNATTAGATILVPAWFFTVADGSVATTAIAVDPAYLGTPPQPSDVAIGGGTSAGSGGGGGASGFSAVPPVGPPAVAPSADGPSVGAPEASAVAPKPSS
jgi:hypothetical protein